MTIANYLTSLTELTDKAEEQILAQALEVGLRQLWREKVLARYLRGKISRQEAIDSVGWQMVKLAEEQEHSVMEDIRWALNA